MEVKLQWENTIISIKVENNLHKKLIYIKNNRHIYWQCLNKEDKQDMIKKKMIALIMVMVMISLVACTPNATSTSQESTTPQETTTVNNDESTSAEEGTSTEYDNTSDVYGRVDVEDICKHIMINGKQVDFPWTLNALGDEYEFRTITDTDETDGVCASTLVYNGKLGPQVVICEEGKVDRDSNIVQIWSGLLDGVQLYDFDINTSAEIVKNKFGEPDKITENQFSKYFYYYADNFSLTMTFGIESKLLDYIIIEVVEKK